MTFQARWVKILSRTAPTLAFHANVNNSFGKGSLISLLRQYSSLHSDKKQISVGFVGYPNTGKSSIINTVKRKKVCKTAPIPGETKVWQYVALMRRIYLIDCPGIVPISSHDSETGTVLKGVVRVENLETPAEHIPAVLGRAKAEHIRKTYSIESWTDSDDFLGQVAKKAGKLLRGGEPDLETAAKMVLNDWIRGKLPFFVAPPEDDAADDDKAELAPTSTKADASKAEVAGSPSYEGFENASGSDDLDADEDDSGEDEQDEDSDAGSQASEDDLQNLAWSDVFGDASNAAEAEDAGDDQSEDASDEEISDADDATGKEKAPRMKTSKRRAENFYTHANVKNKNRQRTKANPAATRSTARERGPRIGANGKGARGGKRLGSRK